MGAVMEKERGLLWMLREETENAENGLCVRKRVHWLLNSLSNKQPFVCCSVEIENIRLECK